MSTQTFVPISEGNSPIRNDPPLTKSMSLLNENNVFNKFLAQDNKMRPPFEVSFKLIKDYYRS
jgi:hypothetical protein